MDIKQKAEQYRNLNLSQQGEINADTLDTLYPVANFDKFEINGDKIAIGRIPIAKTVLLKKISKLYYSEEAEDKVEEIMEGLAEFTDKDKNYLMDNFEEADLIRLLKFLNDKRQNSINEYLNILNIKKKTEKRVAAET